MRHKVQEISLIIELFIILKEYFVFSEVGLCEVLMGSQHLTFSKQH